MLLASPVELPLQLKTFSGYAIIKTNSEYLPSIAFTQLLTCKLYETRFNRP
jgi:hypothetical protein